MEKKARVPCKKIQGRERERKRDEKDEEERKERERGREKRKRGREMRKRREIKWSEEGYSLTSGGKGGNESWRRDAVNSSNT